MTYEEFQENYPYLGRWMTEKEFNKAMAGDFDSFISFRKSVIRITHGTALEAQNLWMQATGNFTDESEYDDRREYS